MSQNLIATISLIAAAVVAAYFFAIYHVRDANRRAGTMRDALYDRRTAGRPQAVINVLSFCMYMRELRQIIIVKIGLVPDRAREHGVTAACTHRARHAAPARAGAWPNILRPGVASV